MNKKKSKPKPKPQIQWQVHDVEGKLVHAGTDEARARSIEVNLNGAVLSKAEIAPAE